MPRSAHAITSHVVRLRQRLLVRCHRAIVALWQSSPESLLTSIDKRPSESGGTHDARQEPQEAEHIDALVP